ncbi:hypothetical protein BDB01DRAFT_896989 [Pilobolus umbonatus]|nr:hypothetical protein BDB01DRAFT_896989 [Pilobolus umbonatus]
MLSRGLVSRLLPTLQSHILQRPVQYIRYASTSITQHESVMLNKLIHYKPIENKAVAASVSEYVSSLRPFNMPPPPTQPVNIPVSGVIEEMSLTSVLRKRRLKMNKHKHKKLRKRTRALRKKLGK